MILVAILVALLTLAYCGWRIERWRRTPAELRGDWWGRPEFRSYVARVDSSGRPRRRRNDRRSIVY